MGFKTKAIGLLAGAALALGLVTGAVADTTEGSGILEAGTCGFEIQSGKTNAGFGTWTYNGATDSYELVSTGSAMTQIYASVFEAEPNGTCDLQFEFNGISNGTDTIPLANFDGRVSQGLSSTGWLPGTTFGDPGYTRTFAGSNQDGSKAAIFNLRLNMVDQPVSPGEFTGDIEITLVNAN